VNPKAVASGFETAQDWAIIAQSEACLGLLDFAQEQRGAPSWNRPNPRRLARADSEGQLPGSPAQPKSQVQHGYLGRGSLSRVSRVADMDTLLSAIGLEVIHTSSLPSATHFFPPPYGMVCDPVDSSGSPKGTGRRSSTTAASSEGTGVVLGLDGRLSNALWGRDRPDNR